MNIKSNIIIYILISLIMMIVIKIMIDMNNKYNTPSVNCVESGNYWINNECNTKEEYSDKNNIISCVNKGEIYYNNDCFSKEIFIEKEGPKPIVCPEAEVCAPCVNNTNED